MRYYSTNDRYTEVPLRKAIMQSVAPDSGVYMPDSIPVIPRALFNHIPEMSLTEIAYVAATTLFGTDIPAEQLKSIVADTLSFPIPLRQVSPGIYALELFHGPTGSFKDVGARFMARLIRHFSASSSQSLNVLVATSGNTGNAVARAFENIPGVNVIIFHPQRTRIDVDPHSAANIHLVSVRGSFNQCQQLVRNAYTDVELNQRIALTSANSINIARLLPQTFYFFEAYARLAETGINTDGLTIATPCGNLGNLTAALFAKQMGLPLKTIIAAGHDNERLWGEIQNGQLAVSAFNDRALATNLSRINALIHESPQLVSLIQCHTFSDSDIAEQIVDTYRRYGYIMDRRTAIAYRAASLHSHSDNPVVFLATARADTYPDNIRTLIGTRIPLPSPPENIAKDRRQPNVTAPSVAIAPTYKAIRAYLIDNFSESY